RVLVVDLFIGNHGSQGGFAAGASGGGHGNQQRQPVHDVQQPFHLGQGLFGPNNAGPHSFGAVHAGAAAKSDQALAAVFQVEHTGLLHIGYGGVGYRAVVDDAADVGSFEFFFQMGGQAQPVDAGIRHQHDAVDMVFPQNFGNAAHTFDQFGLTIRQKRQRNAHTGLKDAAKNLLEYVHFSHPFPQ